MNFAGFLQSRGSILANRTRSPRVTVIQLMGNILKQTKCKPVLNKCNLYLAKSQSTEKLKIGSFLVYLNAFLHMLFTATRTDPVCSNLTHPDFFPAGSQLNMSDLMTSGADFVYDAAAFWALCCTQRIFSILASGPANPVRSD